MSNACLTVRCFDRLLVIRQNEDAPTDDDWRTFLDEVRSLRPRLKEMRAMVFSDGGGPTIEQRKQLAAVMGGREIRTAVICDAGIIRFVVSTISLFNKSMRTYSWQEAPGAYSWLGLTIDEQRKVEDAVATMSVAVRSRRHPVVPSSSQYPERD